ncbi:MAG: hypothetical protein ACE5JZ_02970 [Kiloniellales bacterium]
MPTELRRLIFARDELAKAIANYHGVAKDCMPDGHIVFCKVVQDSELHVTVKILPEGESNIQTLRMGVDVIGPALMKHCLDNNIPIPRNAEKSIEVIGENIAMTISINNAIVRLPDQV